MIKAIIFDFDGVILNSNHIKTKAFKDLYKDQKKNVLMNIIKFHKINAGISRVKKIEYFQKKILKKNYTQNEIHKKSKQFSNLVLDKVIKSKFIPGSKKFITNNYNKKLLFISSGTPQDELKVICKRKNISQYFKGIYGSPLKKKDHIINIIKKWKLNKKEILFVGDAMIDLQVSLECKLYFLAIGNNLRKSINHNNFILNDLKNINKIIRKIEK